MRIIFLRERGLETPDKWKWKKAREISDLTWPLPSKKKYQIFNTQPTPAKKKNWLTLIVAGKSLHLWLVEA